VREERDSRIHQIYAEFTMVPVEQFVDNLSLERSWRNVPGDIVECGTWRGGMSAAMATVAPGHRSVLFDSFEGLPDAKSIDGPAAVEWSRNIRAFDNCTADESSAHAAMQRANTGDYEIIRGWFEDTVPQWAGKGRPIAILRLDGDWYESTLVCLKNLFPLVSPGGGVIIDDYYTWDGCTRAVHDYLSSVGAGERVRSTRHEVAYILKL
jgi:O-methyltransferase